MGWVTVATCALKWSSLSWAQSYSATAQASSTPSSPELTPQVRELLPWIPQGRGNHVTSTKLRLLFLSCSVFFSLSWKHISSDLLHPVWYLTEDAQA